MVTVMGGVCVSGGPGPCPAWQPWLQREIRGAFSLRTGLHSKQSAVNARSGLRGQPSGGASRKDRPTGTSQALEAHDQGGGPFLKSEPGQQRTTWERPLVPCAGRGREPEGQTSPEPRAPGALRVDRIVRGSAEKQNPEPSPAPGPVGAQRSLLTAQNVSAPGGSGHSSLGPRPSRRLALLQLHTRYPCLPPWGRGSLGPSPSGARGLWLERKLGLSEGAMEWGQEP